MNRDRGGTQAALASADARPPGSQDRAWLRADDGELLARKAAAENFPVALRLLPRRYRAHLMAVYNFARTVDDIGDEAPRDQRATLLDELDHDLTRLDAAVHGAAGPRHEPRHRVVRGLTEAVAECAIPVQCFRDLIEANRQDQVVTRYETFDQLLGYCALSANPVGRIVLLVFGCSTPERAELSDAICSGLQVVEHLQDVAEDLRAGRVYLPAADMRASGCSEADLALPSAPPPLRQLIAAEADRARDLIGSGAPLVRQLRGPARVAIAGYIAGGRAALGAIAAADYDVLGATRRPTKRRTLRELAAVLVLGR